MVDRTPGAPHGAKDLWIELGRTKLPAHEAQQLGQGQVVSLDTLVDQPVDVAIGGRLVARGEVLVLDGCFCVRITELVTGRTAT